MTCTRLGHKTIAELRQMDGVGWITALKSASILLTIEQRVQVGKLTSADAIGLRVGKVVNQYKVVKHFELAITDASFTFTRKHDAIAAEAALDGIYIIGTSMEAQHMDAADCVRNFKALANVERAFRSLKTIDLKVRPIHHRTADRVRAHILLCIWPITWSGTCAKPGAS